MPVTSTCPGCGHEPRFALFPSQAFCGQDGQDGREYCAVVVWDPSIGVAANMAAMGTVEVELP